LVEGCVVNDSIVVDVDPIVGERTGLIERENLAILVWPSSISVSNFGRTVVFGSGLTALAKAALGGS
jgi:hypothetical protein